MSLVLELFKRFNFNFFTNKIKNIEEVSYQSIKSLRKLGPESSSSRPNIRLLKSFGQISISTNFNSGKFYYSNTVLEVGIRAVGSSAVVCYLLL